MMKLLDLVQGEDAWLAARLDYLCASEAPAMMGVCKFTSRNALLDMKKGWQNNPVSYFTQKLYNSGHEHEESARNIVEINTASDYPPAVGFRVVDGLDLLASFDGYSEDSAPPSWEHKDWNKVLAANVRNNVLEEDKYWQLEHQALVIGSDSVRFTCSDGGEENRVEMIYISQPELREELILGWKQFLTDLDKHELTAKKEVVVANDQPDFPLINCHVDGSMVVSNLGDYIPMIKALAEEQMSIVLETDQDFADKEAFNKKVKESRANLKITAKDIEAKFNSLADFNGFVKEADGILQKLQSHGEKQVKESKAQKKQLMFTTADFDVSSHLIQLNESLKFTYISHELVDWAAIIKGKRNFDSMQNAIDSEIANIKIETNAKADLIRKNLSTLKELCGDYRHLFADHATLMLKDNDDLTNLIKTRISDHEAAEKAKQEAMREQIRLEEEAKARKKVEAEAQAKALEEANEAARKFAEEKAKVAAEAKAKADAEKPKADVKEVKPAEVVKAVESVKAAQIVKVYETKIWVESDMIGCEHVMVQHQGAGCEPFEYCTFHYDHRYTSGASIKEAAMKMAGSLGAKAPVEFKQREMKFEAVK